MSDFNRTDVSLCPSDAVAEIREDVQKRRRDRGSLGPRSTKKGKEGNRESRHEKTDTKGTNDKLY